MGPASRGTELACLTPGASSEMHKKEYRYRIQHACFPCRKSFRIDYQSAEQARRAWISQRMSGRKPATPFIEPEHDCPQCGSRLCLVGRAFRAPRHSDEDAWTAAELLYRAGYRFHSCAGNLPMTPSGARAFIAAHRPRSPGVILAETIHSRSRQTNA